LLLFRLRHYDEAMSFSETIFLFFAALILFGPKKLPEIARQAGKLLGELRRASNEFRSQIEQEIAHLEVEKTQTILPPSDPPHGVVASRSLNSVNTESEPASPATLAAPVAEASANLASAEGAISGPPSTEAAAPSPEAKNSASATEASADPLAAPASQEFHA